MKPLASIETIHRNIKPLTTSNNACQHRPGAYFTSKGELKMATENNTKVCSVCGKDLESAEINYNCTGEIACDDCQKDYYRH